MEGFKLVNDRMLICNELISICHQYVTSLLHQSLYDILVGYSFSKDLHKNAGGSKNRNFVELPLERLFDSF